MSIIICLKIATLLKPDVLHKLCSGEGEGRKKEKEARRRICHLAWHRVPLAHRKVTSHWSQPQSFLLGFLLQKSLKANCFNRKGSSFPSEDKQESCSWRSSPGTAVVRDSLSRLFSGTHRACCAHGFPDLLRFRVDWATWKQPLPSFEEFLWAEAGLLWCVDGAMWKRGAVLWLKVELLGSLYWGSPPSPSLAEHMGRDPLSKAPSIPPWNRDHSGTYLTGKSNEEDEAFSTLLGL